MRSRGNSRSAAQSGYTLLELLVAITLFGLVVAMVASGVRLGTRVWERERPSAGRTGDTQVVREFLRRALEQMVPEPVDLRDARAGIMAGGDSQRLWFISTRPAASAAGGRYLIKIEETTDVDGRQLVLTWERLAPGESRTEFSQAAERRALLDGIANLDIAYGAAGATADGWSAVWQGEPTLPPLIRLRVGFPETDRRSWTDLVVPTRIDASLACLINGLAAACDRGKAPP
jgi:general secretion pathway protein J